MEYKIDLDLEEITSLFLQGEGTRSIAEKFGVNKDTIRLRLKNSGVTASMKPVKRPKCCPDKVHYAREMCQIHYREWQRRQCGIGVPVTKKCPVCLENFPALRTRIYCGTRCKGTARSWMFLFKLSPGDYYKILDNQNGRCNTCQTEVPTGNKRFFSVDHDHLTNKVRSLLCNNCNAALGMVNEDPRVLRNLANYIEEHKNDSGNI